MIKYFYPKANKFILKVAMSKIKGFTLIELLVVVAIIGALAAVGVVAYNGYTAAAKANAVKAQHRLVQRYIVNELGKCHMGETLVMKGNLECSGREYQDIVDATIAVFSDMEHVYAKGKTVVTDGGSYSNNATKDDQGSKGYIRLQSPYSPSTHILIGTCYRDPCLLNKVEKYLEDKIQFED
tara:strand:+ start:83 stop:628 length:546 start_codon:yes stop_codon:yes gene_type:complete